MNYRTLRGRLEILVAVLAVIVALAVAVVALIGGGPSTSAIGQTNPAAAGQVNSSAAGKDEGSGPCPPSEVADANQLASLAEHGSGSGHSAMGHAPLPTCVLPREDRIAFDEQLKASTAVARRYLKLQDAITDGYTGGSSTFEHYIKWSLMDETFDPAKPEQLLFDKDGSLIGLSYYVIGPRSELPTGFAGSIDRWHRHDKICVDERNNSFLAVDGDLSEAACRSQGGSFGTVDGWMLHVSVVYGRKGIHLVFNPSG